MKNTFFIFVCLLFITQLSSAQSISTGKESKKATVNFMELAHHFEQNPLPKTRKPLFDEDDERRGARPVADPSLIHLFHGETVNDHKELTHVPYLPVSPSPSDTFESTPSDHTGIPPDTHGAVDSLYCITAINTAVHIQSRSGTNVSNLSLDAFWSPLLVYGPGSFDPRVHYDPYYKKWIMVTDAYGQSTNSMIFVAVSVTSDPTGLWHMYSINVDASGNSWLDFPNVGFNKKWIVVTGNVYPNVASGYSGAVVYVIDYASIMAGTGAPFTRFNEPSSFTICPALTYDGNEPNLFMLENWDNTHGQLRLWKVTGNISTPSLTTIGYPATTTLWQSNPGAGNFLPQVGSLYTMESGDDRITSCTYKNNKLWCSHTGYFPYSGTVTHSSILWWQIDTLGNPLQNGLVNDASAANCYAYSSIAVNKNDDALIGFGCFSHSIHPSCGYALHLHSDAASSVRPPVVYRHGLASYYETFGSGRNRWGDYSGTCIDPRNDTDFWTIQETSITGTSPNWDTWWANVQFCQKPHQPAMAVMPAAPCPGATAVYVIDTILGATSYVWNVSGTGWSGTGGPDTFTVTGGTGVGTVSVVAYNSCGEGEVRSFSVTPTALPHRPTITTVTAACIGDSTATFSAVASGATGYSWSALDSGWSGSSSSTFIMPHVGFGTGRVICVPSNSCGNGPADTILVTPQIIPTATFTLGAHTILAYTNDTMTFTGTAPAGSTFNWYFGGGTGSPGTGVGPQIVQWTVPGLKTVTLTVTNNGCTSTIFSDTVHVLFNPSVNVSGVSMNNDENAVKIVPNPNDGIFEISWDEMNHHEAILTLMDMQGKQVFKNDYSIIGLSRLSLNISNLTKGTYMAVINIDGNVASKMITIIK